MPKSRVDKAIEDFIVIPLIVVIGIYVVASVIGSILGLNNEFVKWFFAAVGGIGYFIYYFKKKMSEL